MTLSPIAILDIIATIAYCFAFLAALRFSVSKIGWEAKTLICFGLATYMVASSSNVLEHSGISSALDAYEASLEILFLPFVMFFFYALRTKQEISYRLQSEKELRASRQKYQAILDNIGIGVALLDPEMRIVSINRKMREWFPNIDLGQKPICYSSFNDPPREQHCTDCPVIKTFQDGLAHEDLTSTSRGAEILSFRTVASPLKDSTGKVVGVIKLVDDITTRVKSEKTVRMLQSAIEQLSEGLVVLNQEGVIIFANNAIAKMHGYEKPAEIIGKLISIFHTPEQMTHEVLPLRKKITEFGAYQAEVGHMRKDGSVFPTFMSTIIFKDKKGNIAGRVATITDLSKQKETNEALRKSEDKFRALAETSLGCLWEFDENKIVKYASQKIKDILGYEPEEVLGKSFLQFLTPDEAERIKNILQSDQPPLPINQLEAKCLTKDGQVVVLDTNGVPFFDSSGTFRGYRGISRDITTRKKAEETQRKFEAQMQQMQKFESLSILAGGVAHDFNNLLMVISGNADLGLMETPKDTTLAELLQEIKDAAIRASKLSNQMRAYSGQGHVGMEQLVFNDIVAEILRLLKTSIPKQIHLEYDFASNLPIIEADTAQINQVIMNLLINASEAIDEKKGTISIRTKAFEATRDYLSKTHLNENLPTGQYLMLEISDTGCGMDAETKEKIFDPFFTTKFIGRGLGLAATLGIIRGHHGAIRVISEPEKGSTFQVIFPAGKETALPQTTPPNESIREWKGHGTVLVVDDEKSFLNVASIILKRSGFVVCTAEDGKKAIDCFGENHEKVVAILLDMSMPGMSGEETFAELQKIDDNVPVFLCSGFPEQDAVKHFSGGGLAGFLQKPFQIDTLLSALRNVIEP